MFKVCYGCIETTLPQNFTPESANERISCSDLRVKKRREQKRWKMEPKKCRIPLHPMLEVTPGSIGSYRKDGALRVTWLSLHFVSQSFEGFNRNNYQ